MAQADVCVNFAAESHVDNSLNDPEPFLHSNVIGTIRYWKRRANTMCDFIMFIRMKSGGDLPLTSAEKFAPDSRYQPSSPYSATKAASDMLVHGWTRSFLARSDDFKL